MNVEDIVRLDEAKATVIKVRNLSKRADIDEVLQKFEHDINNDNIIMEPLVAQKFMKAIGKKKIKL